MSDPALSLHSSRPVPYDWSVEVPEWRSRPAPPLLRLVPSPPPAPPQPPARPPLPRHRLTRRGRVVVITGAALSLLAGFAVMLVAVAAFGAASAGASTESRPSGGEARATTVTVEPGDTLWDIAEQVHPDIDPRRTVHELVEINQLSDSGLKPGQQLRVPAP